MVGCSAEETIRRSCGWEADWSASRVEMKVIGKSQIQGDGPELEQLKHIQTELLGCSSLT
jgi:hypothetical protein